MSWYNDPTAVAAMVAACESDDWDKAMEIIGEAKVEAPRAEQEAETGADKTRDEEQGAKRDQEEEHGVETVAVREEPPMKKPMHEELQDATGSRVLLKGMIANATTWWWSGRRNGEGQEVNDQKAKNEEEEEEEWHDAAGSLAVLKGRAAMAGWRKEC